MPFVYPILPYKLKMAVYKRGNSWTVQVSWYISDPDTKSGKKKKYKTKGGFRTKAQAKK